MKKKSYLFQSFHNNIASYTNTFITIVKVPFSYNFLFFGSNLSPYFLPDQKEDSFINSFILRLFLATNTKFTDIIKKETGRLVNLLNDMALPVTSVEKENINLHEATEHVIDLFKFDLKNKEVKFDKDYDPSIPDVLTNKEQLIQTLINLVRNSIQALEYKGNVLIKTRSESSYTIGNKKYQLVAKIDVIDDGPGIPEEKLKEIFYPMVTTKNDGMGLGLTIAQSIVMQNSGLIECSSKHRETKFTIVLPIRSYEDE